MARFAPLDNSRPLTAMVAIGIARAAMEHAIDYSKQRTQFGKPIADFQAIQFMIADMASDIEASRLLTYKSAWLLDDGQRNTLISSYAKRFSADMGMKATTDARCRPTRSPLAALLFNLSLQRIEAQLVGLFTYLEPLGAALLGVLVLGDPFGLSTAAGLVLVLAAGGWAATQRIEVRSAAARPGRRCPCPRRRAAR